MDYNSAVSKIINSLEYLTKDNRVSRRYVLKLLKDRSKTLIAQKNGERTLGLETNLYTEIKCVEFEQILTIDCPAISFQSCNILMKSKKPLPELIFSRLGASIKEITSIDGIYEFTLVDEAQYRRNKKRQYSLDNEVYVYLGTDNHLYIVDQEIYTVDVTILTMNTEDADECSECSTKDKCVSAWESEFIVPDKLEDVVFKEVIQLLGGTNKQIPADPNPNGVEGA